MDDGGIFPWLPTTGTPGGGACGITLELTTPGRKMGVDDSPSAIVVVLEMVKQMRKMKDLHVVQLSNIKPYTNQAISKFIMFLGCLE